MSRYIVTYFNDQYWIAARVIFMYTWFIRIKYMMTYCFIVLIATLQTVRLLDGTAVLFIGMFMALLVQIEADLGVGAVLADHVRIKMLVETVATDRLTYRSYAEILTKLSVLKRTPPVFILTLFRRRFHRAPLALPRELVERVVEKVNG